MAYVFIALAIGLAIGAWKTSERSMRIGFAAGAILNALGAAKAIVSDDPWAYRLKPNDGSYSEPAERADRRGR